MTKRELILEASLKIFVEYGFHGAPITKLISEAGFSNVTFFHYFKTKEELITELYVEIKRELYDTINKDIRDSLIVKKTLRSIWMNWVIWGSENPTKFKFLELFSSSPFINNIDKEAMRQTYLFTSEILNKGINDELLIDKDIRLLNEIIYGSIRGTILYIQKCGLLKEKDMEEIFGLLWKSIVNF